MAEEEVKETRDELMQEKERRAKRYGIAPKDGTPLTPPKGYPESEEEYGDPVNYKYPIDEAHIRAALTYFNRDGMREDGGYTEEEWAVIGKRIAQAATRLLGAKYQYRAGKVVRVEEKSAVLLDEDGVRIGGYAVVYGEQDLTGDKFTPETDLWLDKPAAPRPLLYEHGFHPAVGKAVIGWVKHWEADENGIWIEAELDRHSRYLEMVRRLINAGAVGLSTGAVAHLVEPPAEERPAPLKSWPVFEVSLTVQPAEPRTLGVVELHSMQDVLSERPELKSLMEPHEEACEAKEADGASEADEQQDSSVSGETVEVKMEEIKITDEFLDMVAEAVTERLKPTGLHATGVRGDDGFKSWLRTGQWPKSVKAELVEGTGSRGGYLVPEEYAKEIITGLAAVSLPRKVGVAIRRSTSMRYHWPVMSFSTKAVITGEGSAYSEAEPTFSELIFTPYKFTKLAKVSEELTADAMFDIWRDVLSPDFTQAFAAAENYYFILGSGTSQPQGILAGGSVAVTAAATTAITADELLQLYHSLHPDYRSQAVWIMNDATALYLRGLIDTTGRSLWVPGLADGTPDMLLGRPVFTASEMPTIAAGAKVIAFMVPAYYGIVSREDLAVTRLDELYATSGYVGFIGRMRWDGKVLLSDAVKLLAMKSGT